VKCFRNRINVFYSLQTKIWVQVYRIIEKTAQNREKWKKLVLAVCVSGHNND